MAQIIPFPIAERIEVWSGTDKTSGMPVIVLDLVSQTKRVGVGYYFAQQDANDAITFWQGDGMKVVWL